jgi:VWFA-related protein
MYMTLRRFAVALAALAAVATTTVLPAGARGQAGTRERTLFVSAVDNKGEPIEGLDADAFVVREDGRRREVLRVSKATEPIDIAVLVDNSQAASTAVPFIRDALSRFVVTMAPRNRVAVIGLAERPTVIVEYTSDQLRLNSGIARLFAISGSGMTLLDAVAETSAGLRKRQGPRAAIIPVITDGVEFTNRNSKDVARAALSAGAALHVITLGVITHTDEHAIRERSLLLDEGPRLTGGQHITLLAPNPLGVTLERLARELSAQYKVVFGSPDSLYRTDDVKVTSARAGVTMRGTLARGETGASK